MKQEINVTEVEKHNRYGNIFAVLFVICLISFVPLVKFFKIYGFVAWGILFLISFVWACKVREVQKDNDISTYKEIVAFSEGKMLDEIQKQREIGKRPYQNVLKVLFGAALGAATAAVMLFLLGVLS